MIFKRETLKKLTINITDGEHGSVIDDPYGGYYLLSNKNIINGRIKYDDSDRIISKSSFEKISKRTKLHKNDVVLSTVGTIGKTAIIRESDINFDFQRSVGIIKCDFEKILPEYLYYYLNQDFVQKRLINVSKGAVQKCLFINDLENLIIDIPSDINFQQQIVSILSSIDSKIALNNRINAELEAMAKTVYDYWFVQFDFPFDFAQGKPSVEGKPYKSSGGKMVWREELKREVPEGWEVKRLEKVEANIITGKTPSTKDTDNFGGNIPFITIDDIRQQLYILQAERTLSIKGAESQSTKYLKYGDICVSCIGTVGVIGLVSQISQTNQQINTISIENPNNRFFLLNALKDYFKFNVAAKKGAVLDNMNKAEFSDIPILDAPSVVKESYRKHVESTYLKIENNLKENQQLSSLRDWLLPMLMNGQVKVQPLALEGEQVMERLIAAEPGEKYGK